MIAAFSLRSGSFLNENLYKVEYGHKKHDSITVCKINDEKRTTGGRGAASSSSPLAIDRARRPGADRVR